MLCLDLFCASVSKMCQKVIASPLYTILAYERFPRNSLLSDRRETDSCIIPFSSSIVAWPSSPLMSLHLILLLLSLRRMPVIEFSSLRSNLGASFVAQLVKNLLAMWETWVQSLGWEDPLEKGKIPKSDVILTDYICKDSISK